MKNTQNQLIQQWDQASSRILQTAINNKATQERSRKLNQFTTPELEAELLNRQNCQFNHLACTQKAEEWIIKSQDPTCFNCKQDILSLKPKKSHDKNW